MKKIKIFLASSITELETDRDKLQAFVDRLNEFYFDYGIRISLFRCEDGDKAISAEGKQFEFDREIRDSELCLFLFFKKLGEYTRHEFDVALAAFKNCQKPKIVTYFKYVNTPEEAMGEVKAFMDMLDGEIKHYYNIYQNVDTLKLGVLMQLKMMKLDGVDPQVEKGKVMFGGEEVADTANLPVFTGNGALKKLKEELSGLTEKYYSLRTAMRENPDDDGLYDEYAKIASQKAETEKKLQEAEKAVLEAARVMTENTSRGNLSARQVAAYRAFEKGDYAGALEILDLNEILSDFAHMRDMAEGLNERMQINSNELLQRIEVLKAGGIDGAEAKEIRDIYEEIYSRVQKYNLDKSPLYDFAEFLYGQRDYNRAAAVAEKLQYYYSDPDIIVNDADRADLSNLLGHIYRDTRRLKDAEEAYYKSYEIRRRLADKNPDTYEIDVAKSYNNLGIIYANTGRIKEAEEAYLKSFKTLKSLAEKNPQAYSANLAIIYYNIGLLHVKLSRVKEAEEAYLNAVEIFGRLAQKNPEEHNPDLAMCYNGLGILYSSVDRIEDTEKCYLKALDIRKSLAERNPEAYSRDLALTYSCLAGLYSNTGRKNEAEEAYLKAIGIFRPLAQKNPEVYNVSLANCYHNLGIVYYDTGRRDEAEEYYLKSVEIFEKSAAKNPAEPNPDLAYSYNSLGVLCYEAGRRDEAEGYYKKALEIRRELAAKNPALYDDGLAEIYHNLGHISFGYNRKKEAEDYFLKAFEIRKKLAAESPEKYNGALAGEYGSLAALYDRAGRNKKAGEYYLKSIEIYEALAKKNPWVYNGDLLWDYTNLGNFYAKTGRINEAAETCLKIIEIYKNGTGGDSEADRYGMAKTYVRMGAMYKKAGCLNEAEKAYSAALGLYKILAEKDVHIYGLQLWSCHMCLGDIYCGGGRYEEAIAIQQEGHEIILRMAKENSSYDLWAGFSYRDLGGTYGACGRFAEAAEAYTRSLEILNRIEKESPCAFAAEIVRIYCSLSEIYAKAGDGDGERKAVREAYNLAQKYLEVEECAELADMCRKKLAKWGE